MTASSSYTPPLDTMITLLKDVIGVTDLPHFKGGDLDADMIDVILQEAGRLAAEELAPLNHTGDGQGTVLRDGKVTTADGFKAFYDTYRENGWNAVPFTPEYGGQGLPWSLAFAVQEMWQAANMSFGLCPMLNQGAVDALEAHGTEDQKAVYLEKMISGEWTGTMNLTEPQAGSDLAQIKTKAEKQADGSYKITGQKIYITYGEHDFTDNIIHFVLARTPDAPAGVKGISLFLVPKFIPDENGKPGLRNDLVCTGIEHKLGIHASPTCTMQFGDQGGATGWLIGQENDGLKCMFTMMNNARLSVGLQGVALADRAYQHALAYAQDRKQGTAIDDKDGARIPISGHQDVKRMLLTMQALTKAGRAMAYHAAYYVDCVASGNDEGDDKARSYVDLLTPIVKSWCTDRAVDVASLGVQVHGGMGFIEETGAAQYYRDARILPIYEGTNGIQALDLHGRKVLRDKGAVAFTYIEDMRTLAEALPQDDDLGGAAALFANAVAATDNATRHLLTLDMKAGSAVNKAYLELFGYVVGAQMLLKTAQKTGDTDAQKIALFYATNILPVVHSLAAIVENGADSILDYTF